MKEKSEFKTWRMFWKICDTLLHHYFVISFTKRSGWFNSRFHPYKNKLTVLGVIQIFNQTVGSLRVRFGLVWFYGISTIVGYLMPNPVYT